MNRKNQIEMLRRKHQSSNVDKFERNFWLGFLFLGAFNLFLWGVAIWAVIELVQWVTSK